MGIKNPLLFKHMKNGNTFNAFSTELNPIGHLLALLGTHHILYVS